MSLSKQILLPAVGEVTIRKRRKSRHMRISISHEGKVSVSIPTWAPFSSGVAYVTSKEEWILKHRVAPALIRQRQPVGKAHHFEFILSETAAKPSTRITGNAIRIFVPLGQRISSTKIQTLAKKAAVKALTKEAKALLPQRLDFLARQHGFTYKSVGIKTLKSRWGSCSNQGDITLNCYMMQLPWELIDYVILHELVHTVILAHGPKFWTALGEYLPNLKEHRKKIKTFKPNFSNL